MNPIDDPLPYVKCNDLIGSFLKFSSKHAQAEVELNQNPINYGAWDSCASAKAVPINMSVMRAKREFLTPAWEREALAKLKEEGRDIASIDKDLKVRKDRTDKTPALGAKEGREVAWIV